MPNATISIKRGAEYLDRVIANATLSDIAECQPATANAIVAGLAGPKWPEPSPLTTRVDSEPYPLDALPAAIRAAVEEVLGFTKAPIPMVASSALAALSLAAQALVDVARADKLQGPTGLFLLTIADSGERKSTCDNFFMSPIREHEKQREEAAKPHVESHRAAYLAWEAKRDGVLEAIRRAARERKDPGQYEADLRVLEREVPKAPLVPRLIYGDATPEALTWALKKTWPSAGVISSEAGSVFGSHGMNRDSIMRNLATLNELWDGKPLRFDRRTSESYTVRGARLTVALQVQGPTLRSFFERSQGLARGTGFLARFLVAWPKSTQGCRLFAEAPAEWPALAAFRHRIATILKTDVSLDEDGGLAPTVLTFAPDAKAAWVAFHDKIEGELRSGGELYDVRDVASKVADNAARLSALFHVFDSRSSNNSGSNIGRADFDDASRIAWWHLNEAKRFFGELALPVELADAARLDSWLVEYCRRERVHLVPTQKVQQFGPSGLRRQAAIENAVSELEVLGRVRLVHGAKRKAIQLNPALLTGGVS